MKTLLVDNYDSFSYNIFQMVAELNSIEPDVIKNDLHNWEKINFSFYDNIIISPGPGHPDKESDFGSCKKLIATINKPILGICLGHQGIASLFGGQVVHADNPVHGQINTVFHNNDPLFASIPNQFNVVRYHSLVVDPDLPDTLELICWTSNGIVMGIKHQKKCIRGIQFHPESICSEYGFQLFKNFNDITRDFYSRHTQPGKLKSKSNITLSSNKNALTKLEYKLHYKELDFNASTADLFSKLYRNDKNAIWLDSNITENDMSNLSIIALSTGPLSYSLKYFVNDQLIEIKKDSSIQIIENSNIFDYLNNILLKSKVDAQDFPFAFQCGFVGYFGYELKKDLLPVKNKHSSTTPDSQFLYTDRSILIDHRRNKCYLLALDLNHQYLDSIQRWFREMESIISQSIIHKEPIHFDHTTNFDTELYFEMSKENYLIAIEKCLNYIKDGDSYEICLTNRININIQVDPFKYYLILRNINPAPYAAFLSFDDCHIASASIERFLKVGIDGWIETKPIKGSLPRKNDLIEDDKMKYALKNEIKFKSENLMIVDLLRNDLGKVCKIGSVHVPNLMAIESYKTIHQLVSTIRGKKKENVSTIDCIKTCFPGGSMTGAPKLRTLEIIDELESSPRGIYSGAIGYLSLNGVADLSIVIRTAVITKNKFSVGVGGAIIALSDPGEEYEETILKSKSLIDALSYYEHQTSVESTTWNML